MTTSPASSTATTSPARPHVTTASSTPTSRPGVRPHRRERPATPRCPAPIRPVRGSGARVPVPVPGAHGCCRQVEAVALVALHVHVHSQITRPAGPGRFEIGAGDSDGERRVDEVDGPATAVRGVRLALLETWAAEPGLATNRDGRVAYAVLLSGRVPDAGTTRVGDGRRVVELRYGALVPGEKTRTDTAVLPTSSCEARRGGAPAVSPDRRIRRARSRVWVTPPSPPGLPTLTVTAVFATSSCAAPTLPARLLLNLARGRVDRRRRGCLRSGVGFVLLDDRGPAPARRRAPSACCRPAL